MYHTALEENCIHGCVDRMEGTNDMHDAFPMYLTDLQARFGISF